MQVGLPQEGIQIWPITTIYHVCNLENELPRKDGASEGAESVEIHK